MIRESHFVTPDPTVETRCNCGGKGAARLRRKYGRELMRSCHTFRKIDDRLDSAGTSPVGCHNLGTHGSLIATAQIAGAFIVDVDLPVEGGALAVCPELWK